MENDLTFLINDGKDSRMGNLKPTPRLPKEIYQKVRDYLKEGKSSKEISTIMQFSLHKIDAIVSKLRKAAKSGYDVDTFYALPSWSKIIKVKLIETNSISKSDLLIDLQPRRRKKFSLDLINRVIKLYREHLDLNGIAKQVGLNEMQVKGIIYRVRDYLIKRQQNNLPLVLDGYYSKDRKQLKAGISGTKYICPICDLNCASQIAFLAHIRTKHD